GRPRRPGGCRECRTQSRLASVATVSPVRHLPGVRALCPVLLALTAAEGGARLLAPRDSAIEPAKVDPRAYFSGEQIERGARFARPQMRIGLGRVALELIVLAALARRTAGGRRGVLARRSRRQHRPVAGGAIAGAALAAGSTLLALPLSAL